MNEEAGFTIYKEDGTANMTEDSPWKTPDQGASTWVLLPLTRPEISPVAGASVVLSLRGTSSATLGT